MKKTKKLLTLATLLCSGVLCAGVGAAVWNNDVAQSVHAETATETVAEEKGMSFGKSNVYQMADALNVIPKTIEISFKYDTLPTANATVVGNYSDDTTKTNLSVQVLKADGAVNLYYKNKNSTATNTKFADVKLNGQGYVTLTITLDDSTAHCYVNGVEQGTGVTNNVGTVVPDEGYVVGGDLRQKHTAYWQDEIKSVAMYSDVRNAEEILSSYENGIDNSDENLLVYYDLAGKTNGVDVIENLATAQNGANPLVNSFSAETVTATDIADFETSNEYYSNNASLMGIEMDSIAWSGNTYNMKQFANSVGTDSIGITCRVAQDVDSFVAATTDASTGERKTGTRFLYLQIGTRAFWLDYRSTGKIRVTTRYYGSASGGASGFYLGEMYSSDFGYNSEFEWDETKEHVVTLTRAKHTHRENTWVYAVYLAEVATDGTVGTEKCVWKFSNTESVVATGTASNCERLAIFPATTNSTTHTMTISSNKYVGVQTKVGDTVTVNKVVRGEDFTFANLNAGSTVHAGWSKGADTYSEEDYVANGTVFENMTVSDTNVYEALTMEMQADEKASLRFIQRLDGETGAKLPVEISLKWNVTASDSNGLADYFGGIQFGYVSSSNYNDKTSGDIAIDMTKVTEDNVNYAYGIIQANIDEDSQAVEFVCQAWVELNGVKYYTTKPAEGRSVDYVAYMAKNDLKTEGEVANGVTYANEIKDADGETLGWSYLTQAQWDLVAAAAVDYVADAE